jgi:hypothetical protein
MTTPSSDLVLVDDVPNQVANPATLEETIAILRKENTKLMNDLEVERSLMREIGDVLIENKLRPFDAMNYLAIAKVLTAYKRHNPFWRSRAQEMAEANAPHQKVFTTDRGIEVLEEPQNKKLK